MGMLFFDPAKSKKTFPDYYFVIGKWFLKRKGRRYRRHLYPPVPIRSTRAMADRSGSYELAPTHAGTSFSRCDTKSGYKKTRAGKKEIKQDIREIGPAIDGQEVEIDPQGHIDKQPQQAQKKG
jgi:hypothetical protein